MTRVTMKPGGQLTLPTELCERYGLTPTTPIRVIETRKGLLLIPLTDAPMDPELARELAEWQELGAATWN
jgi:bifunctional DNA-binding transcriptional regulator/antitoxin component of YhaV-PrlF toxin-antitoxin module